MSAANRALVCMSHSPLLEFSDPPAEVRAAVDAAFDAARGFVRDFAPDLVVSFGPDHYNGFFYDLMPPYCIGFAAAGVGDYQSWEGPLDVPAELAEQLAQHVIDADVDVAISRAMELDHGGVQPLEILFQDPTAIPVVPVFVNGVARPFVAMERVRRFGEAVGRFFTTHLADRRVLFLGSGGLSHDPPVPQWATATDAQRQFLTNGRHPTPEARAAREQNTINTAKAFAGGTASIMDLNPAWDRAFLDICRSGNLTGFDALDADEMDAVAGHSSHEVRTWVAAHAAMAACGAYRVGYEFYRPIKEYIAGFAVLTATPR